MTPEAMAAAARAAAKEGARWVYRRRYVTGDQTIACREPGEHQLHLTTILSWDYAREAGVSTATARAHLRRLAAAGVLVEHRHHRVSGVCRFAFPNEVNEAIGRELIAELVAEGLPFDDDWRASRA
ncbi:MAG TPA: hypothetical protein VIG97_11510 [Luteimonas sp.]